MAPLERARTAQLPPRRVQTCTSASAAIAGEESIFCESHEWTCTSSSHLTLCHSELPPTAAGAASLRPWPRDADLREDLLERVFYADQDNQ